MSFGKKYDPGFEQHVYNTWEKSGEFHPLKDAKKESFVMLLPPPNVTGKLHIGHSIMLAIEDNMVRYQRMIGKETVWIPGTDHASISTEVVVENLLKKEQGITKEDLGREKFLGEVWKWVSSTRDTITKQVKAMGASVDRSREQFTMSERLSRSVRKAFKKLYEQGKIYKSNYMVNRSPGAQTVLSDLEVESKDVKTKMYYLRYFVQGKGDKITVATTRPETMFADVAIAVHPKDKRFKKWIGRNVLIPVINKPIPVIADESVQVEIGTGALKITPTHSQDDYEIAINHDLPLDQYALDKNNVFTELAGEDFAGKHAYDFFDNLIQYVDEIGNLEKIEDYETTIPICERTGELVQPLLSQQWFMGVKRPAERLMESIDDDKVTIHPERFKKTFTNWLDEIRPWCISRQLRWGHRIPVRYDDDGNQYAFDEEEVLFEKSGDYCVLSRIIFNLVADSRLHNPFSIEALIDLLTTSSITPHEGRVIDVYCEVYKTYAQDCSSKEKKRIEDEIKKLQTIFDFDEEKIEKIDKATGMLLEILENSQNITGGGESDTYRFDFYVDGKIADLTQDEDVLDTWFSSALFPFSTLGWPENTDDLKRYYPNSVLETGYDIIFFRVIRMMLLGIEMTDQMPFKDVYLHGLVRAPDGSKMSKSKGNGVDPIKMIDKYGADSLRGGLLLGNTPGNDQKFREEKVDYIARFINKIWNASRFITAKYHGSIETRKSVDFDAVEKHVKKHLDDLNEYDIWMIDTLNNTVQTVTRYQEKFMIGEALQECITLLWHQLCDWYIEIAKIKPSKHTKDVLLYVLGVSYKILHPALPFVTEKLWSQVGFSGSIISQQWPEPLTLEDKNYKINLLMDLISQWRTLKADEIKKPHEKVSIFVQGNKDIHMLVERHEDLIKEIVNVEELTYLDEHEDTPDGYSVGMLMDITLGVQGIVERNWKDQLRQLENDKVEEEAFLQRLRATLSSPGFKDKAPKAVVDEKKDKMQEVKIKISKIQFEIDKIKMNHA